MRKFGLPKILIIAAAIILTGCSDRPSYVPSNSEMADLLYDIHIMESCFRCNYVKDVREKAFLYHSILSDYDMTSGRFDSCITWFCNNRKQYKDVYNIIQARLSKTKKMIMLGKYSLLTEDYPGEYFYTTSNVIVKNMAALEFMGPIKRLDGTLPIPDPNDSIYINLQQAIPEVPYREGFSAADSTAELSTDNSGRYPYVERL
ncbi:MAG: DUF4296 domain-containing protein [Paludibacteraceae bacterium]|nr:DUF4296 domain-containing protein [Paludibacteraceae bacterium]MBQ1752111.1 DUF4296 domain-containing protein [Paludibacteraceae bacterium]MBQ1851510.1 DUF4296 domain-containing protein [Paludibacteraceae bacterium]MBQ2065433.1 DUF4296 domain-containing protein [Paludibacteraceae bacterium]